MTFSSSNIKICTSLTSQIRTHERTHPWTHKQLSKTSVGYMHMYLSSPQEGSIKIMCAIVMERVHDTNCIFYLYLNGNVNNILLLLLNCIQHISKNKVVQVTY